MIQADIAGDLVKRVASSRLGIGATVNDQRQPCLDDGARAHGARLQRDVESAILQTPRVQRVGRLRNGDHLGVGRRIVQLFALVVRLGDDAVVVGNDDRADRHLVLGAGPSRFGQRHFHMVNVKGMTRIGQRQFERRKVHNETPWEGQNRKSVPRIILRTRFLKLPARLESIWFLFNQMLPFAIAIRGEAAFGLPSIFSWEV